MKCKTCKRELNTRDPRSGNCGGDCLQCMADAGDPDARKEIAKLNKSTRTPAQILADLDNAVDRRVFVWPAVGAEAAALIREQHLRLAELVAGWDAWAQQGKIERAVENARKTLAKFES